MPCCSALALTLSFTGCHGTLASGENPAASSSYPVPDEFDTSRRYEVTFWAKNDTNMAQVNIYKQAIADFEALYPNITVNLRLYTDYGKIYNDVITNIATGHHPQRLHHLPRPHRDLSHRRRHGGSSGRPVRR